MRFGEAPFFARWISMSMSFLSWSNAWMSRRMLRPYRFLISCCAMTFVTVMSSRPVMSVARSCPPSVSSWKTRVIKGSSKRRAAWMSAMFSALRRSRSSSVMPGIASSPLALFYGGNTEIARGPAVRFASREKFRNSKSAFTFQKKCKIIVGNSATRGRRVPLRLLKQKIHHASISSSEQNRRRHGSRECDV